jgi:hypothetical protein
MIKQHLPKNHNIIFFLLSVLLVCQCNSKGKAKNDRFQKIEYYFAGKGWDFPLHILDTTLVIRYYHDTIFLKEIPKNFINEINIFEELYKNKAYVKTILNTTILDTLKPQSVGYVISNPVIIIDTSDYGTTKDPNLFLEFFTSKYKINKDSASGGIPCEDCFLEENRKILRYPMRLFLKLNRTKDSLVFSRWD